MSGAEVAIPVYERLREEARRSGRLRDSLLVGVSTRQDARVLPEMAGTVGIRKSRVSRRFTEASRTALEKLGERRLEGLNLLAIDLDGIVVDHSQVLAALGVDGAGQKHLLQGLIGRGLDPAARYLFVIEGLVLGTGGTLRVPGDGPALPGPLCRCRHKVGTIPCCTPYGRG